MQRHGAPFRPDNLPQGGRNATEVNEGNSLMVMGLPLDADKDYILRFVEERHIARGRNQQQLISIFPTKPSDKFAKGRITFTSIENARVFLRRWNKQTPPPCRGQAVTSKLTVTYWVDKTGTAMAPTTPAIPESNVLMIKGLPGLITDRQLQLFIGDDIARGKSHQPLIQIFPGNDTFRSARVVMTTIQAAREVVYEHHKKPFPGHTNKLTVGFYRPQSDTGPKVDEETARRIRQAAVAETRSVMVKGLPENCNEDYLISITKQPIAIGNKGKRLVMVFPGCGSAKITFKTVQAAREFVGVWHRKAPPGYENKLTVQFYLEREESKRPLSSPLVIDKQSQKSKTVVRNVVYIQGLHKTIAIAQLLALVELEIGKKPLTARIYRYPDGKSEGRGTIRFRDAADAQLCINRMDGKVCEGVGVGLKLRLFESTRVRRLENARGNEHRFGDRTVGYAYDCVACFETWDERDMEGCVPIGHNVTDLQTHFMCQECIRGNCESSKIDGRLGEHGTGLPCGEDCKRVLLWAAVKRVLANRDTADRLETRMTKLALNEIEGIEYCKEDCGFGAFIDQDPQRMQFFSCQTRTCMSQFCRICKISFMEHAGKSCDDVDPKRIAEKAGRFKMTAAEEFLSEAKIRTCPKCSSRYTKDNDGSCNKMTCPTCGTTMCYVCKAANIGYEHFRGNQCQQSTDTVETDQQNYNRVLGNAMQDANLREGIDLLRQRGIV